MNDDVLVEEVLRVCCGPGNRTPILSFKGICPTVRRARNTYKIPQNQSFFKLLTNILCLIPLELIMFVCDGVAPRSFYRYIVDVEHYEKTTRGLLRFIIDP